jgi:cell division protein ZipA
MEGFRWVLLLIGAIVIGGVYLYSRKASKRAGPTPAERRKEPSLEEPATEVSAEVEDDEPSVDAFPVEEEVDVPAEPEFAEEPPEQMIVTLRLVAGKHRYFKGDELTLALRGLGLRHGKFGIFHRHDGNDDKRTVFSVASLVEPGSFDLKNLKEQEIPGISMFLVLPGPMDGPQAFDMMMEAARTLVQGLGGELLDETGSTLSIQRERFMREEIIKYQHGIKGR